MTERIHESNFKQIAGDCSISEKKMEFNKKVEKFGMFGLTFEIRKDKKTKCRLIFCQNVMIVNVDMSLGYIKKTRAWGKLEIMEAFSTKCAKTGLGKEQILKYVSKF